MEGKKKWNVNRVDAQTYAKTVDGTLINAFNKAVFSELNRDKVDEIWYLLIQKGNSVRFGVTMGIRGKHAVCPFSAPFAYPEEVKKGMGVDCYEAAGKVLDAYLTENGIEQATIVFPPSFYDKKSIETWMNVAFYQGWKTETVDISFGFHIPDVQENYMDKIAYNAKKNLKIALEAGLSLRQCETQMDKIKAYEVIQTNRTAKGYPLRMTQQQVLDTMNVIPSSMYLVSCQGEDIAAALIYDITPDKAQVIYWGDIPGHSEKKVINYLAYRLIQIYADRGFSYLDIGPSTENGVPNYGLCDFKDSIGCERSAKYRLTKHYM